MRHFLTQTLTCPEAPVSDLFMETDHDKLLKLNENNDQ